MRAYRFRLQRLRDLRRHQEREVEIRFGAAAGAVSGIDRQLDEIDLLRVTTTVSDLAGRSARSASVDAPVRLDPDQLGNSGWYMRRLEQEKQRLLHDRELRTAELAEIAAEYANASKACKVLDKLRERQERAHTREQRDAEHTAADEATDSASARVLGGDDTVSGEGPGERG